MMAGAAGALIPPAWRARAQVTKVQRIGLLGIVEAPWFDGFRAGLRERGHVEGQTIAIEARWAGGQFARLPELALELVRLEVAVIVAFVTQASLAAKAATRTIPIVMVGVSDPVAAGLVASLARPGGNITGTSTMSADAVGKQMELFRELDPGIAVLAVLWNPANHTFQAQQVAEAEAAARRLGIRLRFVEASAPENFAAAFAILRQEGLRALHVLPDPIFTLHNQALVELIAHDRLVAISGIRDFVEAGGLMAFGPSFIDAARRAAFYVDRILKGDRPADLPVELPTRFDLIINLRTARTLGVSIPQALLVRASEVIE
jgi:putative ABC transport system substrate-binding protein